MASLLLLPAHPGRKRMLRTFPGATEAMGKLAATVNCAGDVADVGLQGWMCVCAADSAAENRSLRLGNRGKERCVSFHTGSVSFSLPSLYRRTGAGSGSVWATRFFPIILLLFSSSVVSSSLGHHELQHTRLPCSSLSPRVCLYQCLWSR